MRVWSIITGGGIILRVGLGCIVCLAHLYAMLVLDRYTSVVLYRSLKIYEGIEYNFLYKVYSLRVGLGCIVCLAHLYATLVLNRYTSMVL